jgi:polar amino acid transport system substrate-binding protein
MNKIALPARRARTGVALPLAVLLCIVLLGSCVLSGCAKSGANTIRTAADLNSSQYTICVDAGSAAAGTAAEVFSQADLVYASSISDAYLSVSQGRSDAFVYGRLFMQYALATGSFDDLTILDDTLDTAEIAVGLAQSRADLLPRINAFIAESKASGLLDEMYDRWVLQANATMPEIPQPENPDFTLKIGTSGLVEPITYYDANGALTGYDVELIYRLAAYLNANVELEAMSYDALIASLESGRLDLVVADLNVTEERKQVILMSDAYRVSETAVLVRADMVETGVNEAITSLDQLNGKKIGLIVGDAYSGVVAEKWPEATVVYFPSFADLISGVQRGLISAYITDEPVAKTQMAANSAITYIADPVTSCDYGFVMAKENTALAQQVNEALAELRADGTVEALKRKWIDGEDPDPTIEPDPTADTSKGTLHVITEAEGEPMTYYKDGQIVGYEIELVTRVAERIGYAVDFTNSSFVSLIPAVQGGKYDLAVSCITITEERAESVLFSDPEYSVNAVAVVANPNAVSTGFWEGLQTSFRRTFIVENRWRLIVNGLLVTIQLSVVALVLGSVLGFFFSMALRSTNRWVRGAANAVSTALDAMPILIVLMIFYYIVFNKTSLSAKAIAAFACGIDFANVVAGLLNTGIEAVDKGQMEAAASMGYTKMQIFTKITFPQAAKQMAGQFNGAVVSLIKGTSVVGYITVQDLTKAGDIIRSRTYEAFFPLIVVAVIYFLIAHLFLLVIRRIELPLDYKRRPRAVKGVTSHD